MESTELSIIPFFHKGHQGSATSIWVRGWGMFPTTPAGDMYLFKKIIFSINEYKNKPHPLTLHLFYNNTGVMSQRVLPCSLREPTRSGWAL